MSFDEPPTQLHADANRIETIMSRDPVHGASQAVEVIGNSLRQISDALEELDERIRALESR